MPILTAPRTRTPTRSQRNGPYDKRRNRRSDSPRRGNQKGSGRRPGGGDPRDGWRPSTPETDPPLSPAPLLGLPQLLILLGSAALGALLNPPKGTPLPPTLLPGAIYEWGNLPSGPQQQVRVTLTQPGSQAFLGPAQGCRNFVKSSPSVQSWTFFNMPRFYLNTTSTNACGWVTSDWGFALSNGTKFSAGSAFNSGGAAWLGPFDVRYQVLGGPSTPIDTRPQPGFIPFPRPPLPGFPDPLPDLVPEEAPTTTPLVPPLPMPAPPVAPPVPEPSPPPGPESPPPGPEAPPAFRPSPFPGPTPVAIPLLPPTTTQTPTPTQQLRPDGTTVPPPPATTPQTPPGTEDFLGETIGQSEKAPPPTLEGISSEVGRIEQKLRVLSLQPSGGSGDLSGLEALLQDLKDLLEAAYLGGSYVIAGRCEPVGAGTPQPIRSATWGAGEGQFGQVNQKLDALAELFQHHKDLRQPVCRQKASGEEVTVVFEEIG